MDIWAVPCFFAIVIKLLWEMYVYSRKYTYFLEAHAGISTQVDFLDLRVCWL